MPAPLARGASPHCGLECPQLSDILQILYGLDSMRHIIGIRIAFCGRTQDGFQEDRVFMQMLRRTCEEMF